MESIDKLRRMSRMFDSWHEEHMDGEPYIEVRHYTDGQRDFDSIGDHIRRLLDEIEAEISERYMPLPLDADGVPCKVGDMVEFNGCEFEVFGVSEDGVYVANGDCWIMLFPRGDMHHVKHRTIEDVLEEFGSKMHGITTEERERLVNEAADEIRGMK